MKAVFVELPAFSRYRADYLDDRGFRSLQEAMMKNPEAGDYKSQFDAAFGLSGAASCRPARRIWRL